jgi:hypothetical protein
MRAIAQPSAPPCGGAARSGITGPIASLASIALLGCFPHNTRLRTYSQAAEGAAIVAGIVTEYFVNSAADCEAKETLGNTQGSCKSNGAALGDFGLGLILAGIGGFILTVSTAEADAPKLVELKPVDPDKPAVKLPPGVTGRGAQAAATDRGQ